MQDKYVNGALITVLVAFILGCVWVIYLSSTNPSRLPSWIQSQNNNYTPQTVAPQNTGDGTPLYCKINMFTSVKDLPAYCLKYYQ